MLGFFAQLAFAQPTLNSQPCFSSADGFRADQHWTLGQSQVAAACT